MATVELYRLYTKHILRIYFQTVIYLYLTDKICLLYLGTQICNRLVNVHNVPRFEAKYIVIRKYYMIIYIIII